MSTPGDVLDIQRAEVRDIGQLLEEEVLIFFLLVSFALGLGRGQMKER